MPPERGHFQAERDNAFKMDRILKCRRDFLCNDPQNQMVGALVKDATVNLAAAVAKVWSIMIVVVVGPISEG